MAQNVLLDSHQHNNNLVNRLGSLEPPLSFKWVLVPWVQATGQLAAASQACWIPVFYNNTCHLMHKMWSMWLNEKLLEMHRKRSWGQTLALQDKALTVGLGKRWPKQSESVLFNNNLETFKLVECSQRLKLDKRVSKQNALHNSKGHKP